MPADALARWREDLGAWAIPPEILARAQASPWTFPREVFARRADARLARADTLSHLRAVEALATPGSVLDVGAGAGAASLPLLPRATDLTAVDADAGLLDELATRARALGGRVTTVLGTWPEVADRVAAADLVLCHHVLYNVPELGPFIRALDDHARRRVVVELTERHPLTALAPLWLRFHGLVRPAGPTADDALAAIRSLGCDARAERREAPRERSFADFETLVAVTGRRLCLPPERGGEVAAALRTEGYVPGDPATWGPPRTLVTIWWDRIG